MGEVRAMPNPGDVFIDIRDADRSMRISYHEDMEIVVVSLWAGRLCRASFRLAAGETARLVAALRGAPGPTGEADQEAGSAARATTDGDAEPPRDAGAGDVSTGGTGRQLGGPRTNLRGTDGGIAQAWAS